jgi:hypothetical protein
VDALGRNEGPERARLRTREIDGPMAADCHVIGASLLDCSATPSCQDLGLRESRYASAKQVEALVGMTAFGAGVRAVAAVPEPTSQWSLPSWNLVPCGRLIHHVYIPRGGRTGRIAVDGPAEVETGLRISVRRQPTPCRPGFVP